MIALEPRPLRSLAEVALGRQRSPEHADGPYLVRYLRAANVVDGALDLSDVKEMNFSPAEQEVFALRNGDILVTEGSGSLRTVGASVVWNGELDGVVCFQNTLLRLRPRTSATDSRFLAWWCRHAYADGIFAANSTGANIYHLSAERLRMLPVAAPTVDVQRTIADFLDAETTRVDTILGKKRRFVELLEERSQNLVATLAGPGETQLGSPTLRRTIEATAGGSWGSDPGNDEIDALCIRGTDFDMETLGVKKDSTPNRSFSVSEFSSRKLIAGDLIIEKSGGGDTQPVGRVVQWLGSEPAVPTNFAARLRPTVEVDSRYLVYAFRSAYVSGVTRPWIKQTTGIQNLDVGGLLSERWVVPEMDHQVQIAGRLDSVTRCIDVIQERVNNQIALLEERRQALITAAVTGTLDVSGAAE